MSDTMTAEFRDAVREAKAAIRDGGTDVARRCGMDVLVEAQIRRSRRRLPKALSCLSATMGTWPPVGSTAP